MLGAVELGRGLLGTGLGFLNACLPLANVLSRVGEKPLQRLLDNVAIPGHLLVQGSSLGQVRSFLWCWFSKLQKLAPGSSRFA